MSIFSRVEKHLEQIGDRRLRQSARLPFLLHLLLGRTPARRLAQSLIAVLLLISPISFSTDKITNFTYECPVSCSSAVKADRVAAVQRSAAVKPEACPAQQSGHRIVPASLTPTAELVSATAPSRAPPA